MAAGIKIRLADPNDADQVTESLHPHRVTVQAGFGLLNFHRIIEISLFSFLALDEEGKVVAFASFNDEPSIPGTIPTRKIETAKLWARQEASDLGFLMDSVLWLESFATTLESDKTFFVSENFMCSVFMLCPDLQAVLHPSPARYPILPHLLKLMSLTTEYHLHMCACLRSTVLSVMKVRIAEEEDYENLLPLVKRAQKRGYPLAKVPESACPSQPYAIARLIAAQNKDNTVLVSEVNGKIVGLMSMTAAISNDYCLNFKLEDFYGLTTKEVRTFEIPLEVEAVETPEAPKDEEPVDPAEGARPSILAVAEHVIEGTDSQPTNVALGTKIVQADESQGVVNPEPSAEPEPEPDLDAAEEIVNDEAPKFKIVEVEVPSELRNAFQINMFCMEEEFENQAIDFLHSAFEVDQRDYCLVGYPYTSRILPMLQLFTRAVCRPSRRIIREDLPYICTISDAPPDPQVSGLCLYLMHRDSLYPGFEVRPSKPPDVDELTEFLQPFADRESILDLIEHPRQGCFTMVAVLSAQIVGFAMIEENVPAEALSSHFNIQSLVDLKHHPGENQACITFFTLGPVFRHRRRLFLREIMRQLKKTLLYCPIFPEQDLPDVIEDLLLAPPRQHGHLSPPVMWGRQLETVGPSKRPTVRRPSVGSFSARGLFEGFNCALYLTTHRLSNRCRVVVNSRISVVGASKTAEEFLYNLIASPEMQFTNLNLISPSGFLGFSAPATSVLDVAVGPARSFSKLGIDCQVGLREAAVIGIDRSSQAVLLSNEEIVRYDLLVLALGLQDQTKSTLGFQNVREILRPDDFIAHLDGISGLLERLKHPREATSDWEGPVVVYGSTLEAFSVVQLLLSKGVKGFNIVLAFPEQNFRNDVSCGDANVHGILLDVLLWTQVTMVPGVKLVEVTLSDEGRLKEIVFEPTKKPETKHASAEEDEENSERDNKVRQPCCLLVTCDKKQIDVSIFHSMRRENIAFDGRIVVDGNFQTSDPFIYAAGTVAKFSRRCGRLPTLDIFCSREVGEALACSIMNRFRTHFPDSGKLWPRSFPFSEICNEVPEIIWPAPLTPVLGRPKCTGGTLPGGTQLFCITLPAYREKNFNSLLVQSLITKSDKLYARLDISETKQVARFLYAGRTPIEAWKFQQLVGLPISLLNDLPARYGDGSVNDIVSFLIQTWSSVLLHDKFIPFYTGVSLELIEMIKNHPKGSQVTFEPSEVLDPGLAEDMSNFVTTALISFIDSLKSELPVYKLPRKKVDLKLLLPMMVNEEEIEAQEMHKRVASAAAGKAVAALRAVTDMVLAILGRVTTIYEEKIVVKETVEKLVQEIEDFKPVLVSLRGWGEMGRLEQEIDERMVYLRVWNHLTPPRSDPSLPVETDEEIQLAVEETIAFLVQVSSSLLPPQEQEHV